MGHTPKGTRSWHPAARPVTAKLHADRHTVPNRQDGHHRPAPRPLVTYLLPLPSLRQTHINRFRQLIVWFWEFVFMSFSPSTVFSPRPFVKGVGEKVVTQCPQDWTPGRHGHEQKRGSQASPGRTGQKRSPGHPGFPRARRAGPVPGHRALGRHTRKARTSLFGLFCSVFSSNSDAEVPDWH